MKEIFKYIDGQKKQTLADLGKLVSLRGESADPTRRDEGLKTAKWFESYLSKLGAKVRLFDVGTHNFGEGGEVKNNPVVFAHFKASPQKKTVLIYGHYDVQPTGDLDEWKTNPWKMTEPDKQGYLYGRGVVDDKGEVLSVLKAIEAYVKTGTKLPVNVKMLLEGMEEFGSLGLEEFVKKEKKRLLKDIDSVLICDTEWLDKNVPSVTHSLRGCNYFEVSVKGQKSDVHSGYFGGPLWEPLHDLVELMSRLRNGPMGRVRVPGFYKSVMNPGWQYKWQLGKSGFDVDGYKRELGVKGLAVKERKKEVILAGSLEPTLSMHGFGGVSDCSGVRTIIPSKAVGHFSTRLVPDQNASELKKSTVDFLKREFKKLKSPNKLDVKCLFSGNWWYVNPADASLQAAGRAVTKGFGKGEAVMAGGGCSVPITFIFEKVLGVTPVLIPLGKPLSGAHGPNERHHVDCLIDGSKVIALYLDELGRCTN